METVDKKTLAERIIKARKASKLTQSEIGRQLGIAQTTIANWESARSVIPFYYIASLSKLTKVPLEHFAYTEGVLPEEKLKTAKSMGELLDHKDRVIEDLQKKVGTLESKNSSGFSGDELLLIERFRALSESLQAAVWAILGRPQDSPEVPKQKKNA